MTKSRQVKSSHFHLQVKSLLSASQVKSTVPSRKAVKVKSSEVIEIAKSSQNKNDLKSQKVIFQVKMHIIMLKMTINDFIHIDAAGGGISG